ncbi:MAG: hypothetical protein KDB23_32015, partial [Planctomycetales bacterium]|nr:hypothetical protein [Planctomycetales bacterium]
MRHFSSPLIATLVAVATIGSIGWTAELTGDSNIHLRGTFSNARLRFKNDKQGHVAFIGGSITEMNGYRPMV